MAEPTFTRNPQAEAAAIASGSITKEEIDARGGINAAGYFGDSYQAAIAAGLPYLSDKQYFDVQEGLSGVARGAAINLATAKNRYETLLAQGLSSADASVRAGYDPATNSVITTGKPLKISKGNVTDGSGSVTGDGNATGIYTASDGKKFSDPDAYVAYQANLDSQKEKRQSAYDLLYSQFSQYGLGALVEPLKGLITEGVSPSEFTLRLRETDAYKKRFAANTTRINQGLRALSEAEYIQLEDQYQDVMRRYGMPASYYARGDMGIQPGFEKFIGFDVSPVELEDRIQTAQSRVFDANPEVANTLKQFYPGITNGDILAYVLDPKSALPELKRKITAAEIGAGAKIAGLSTGLERATELASYGVTKEQAQQGFQTIADILPRGSQLASIYGETPYTQTTAEQEVFGLAGGTEAAKQRRKLTSLEQAAFSGQTGAAGGALGRERAGQF
jgi:hypothetical protein